MAEAAPPTLRDVEARIADVHPDAIVSSLAVVGSPGEWRDHPSYHPAIVEAGAVIREFARVHAGCTRPTVIGQRTLVMSGAHVGHDARVGFAGEIAPNAVIGGCCTIGNNVKIGMGAVVLPGRSIGDGAKIGAGAVVTRDVPAGEVWAGVPAKRIGRAS